MTPGSLLNRIRGSRVSRWTYPTFHVGLFIFDPIRDQALFTSCYPTREFGAPMIQLYNIRTVLVIDSTIYDSTANVVGLQFNPDNMRTVRVVDSTIYDATANEVVVQSN